MAPMVFVIIFFFNPGETLGWLSSCDNVSSLIPQNGFWFGLGMCVFFMVPSLIFNIKLAKHFRKMKYSDELDNP